MSRVIILKVAGGKSLSSNCELYSLRSSLFLAQQIFAKRFSLEIEPCCVELLIPERRV